ncbi:hypothetical protein KBD20_00025 [Candidatus Saccharibacteria bacterium]|nr:hypothetical protein [Candidatus Saccharibacteria bacterium]
MREAHRNRVRDSILANAREQGQSTPPITEAVVRTSGAVYMPGIRTAGGIDAILAPRSERQQLAWNIALNPEMHSGQIEGYRKSEALRRIPIVGTYIADILVHHTLQK